ncbi:cupin domain-containing protein [Actinokineospora sp. PR83]|uniref:cupin domain-containing protein n=1 Tax=Actinokineospora sp. PR83 TaxID=2884908 RepID=UPI0027E1725E|nr:cupin domain-containing protein [Actinokineospora sp. PR83]MCG8915760.1 cupin domain-containing protein [Actinokineospora sp. PR83]
MSNTHDGLTRTTDGTAWRCLGRRGMLFSECESFDFVRLAPGATLEGSGSGDVEEVWFVLRGAGEFTGPGGRVTVRQGEVLLLPRAAGGSWRGAGEESVELLLLELMPAELSGPLPPRTPAD